MFRSMIALSALTFLVSCSLGSKSSSFDVDTAGTVAFVEGPAWKDGKVYFTNIRESRIMTFDVATSAMTIYREDSGNANGLFFDANGRLCACEGGRRRVTRTELDGTISVLADRYEGKQFNSPNDLTADSKGRIYFTDPRYGPRENLELFDTAGTAVEGVYRINLDGSVVRVIEHEAARPNGIAISADDRFLFIADNDNGHAGGNRQVWRFELNGDGDVIAGSRKLLHDFGTGRGGDGMTLGPDGLLYVTAGFNYAKPPVETADNAAGVYVLSPEGRLVDFIPIYEDMVTNCTFGGEDGKTLWVTAGHTLFRADRR